jgi:hypothetical protein
MADTVVYVYAVVDSGITDAEVADIRAVDGAAVCVVTEAPVAAVVSAVDAERFSESALRRNLEDPRWLEEIARAHNAVVSDLAHRRPLAPVRLATVFLDDTSVRDLLRSRAQDFVVAIDRVRGRCEWSVKGFAVDTIAERGTATSPTEGLSPGRSYLERRRAERDGKDQQRREAAAGAEAAHQRLADLAPASRRYPPQDRRLTGYQDEMMLNAAYLLPVGEESELRRAVQECQGMGLRLELAGPWAPYSFAILDGEQ